VWCVYGVVSVCVWCGAVCACGMCVCGVVCICVVGGVGGVAFSILRGIYVFSGLREPPSISRRHITRNTNSCRVFTNL